MEIQVNGKKMQWQGAATVLGLVEGLGIRPQTVVVEKNLRIVPREEMASETIRDGDSIEIIRLVGGG